MRNVLLAVTAAAILFGACNTDPVGIFQSIERERKILDDRDLPNDLTIGAMARAGTRYFIAAGAVWYRTIADADYPATVSQWQQVTAPGTAAENYTSTSLAEFDGDVYAVYRNQAGTTSGLYRINAAAMPTPVVVNTGATGRVQRAFSPDGTNLLVSVADGAGNYTLLHSQNGTEFGAVPGFSSGTPVIGVASDTTDLFYLTSAAVWRDEDGPADGIVEAAAIPNSGGTGKAGSAAFTALYIDVSTTLYAADNAGRLYATTDGGTNWARSVEHKASDGTPYVFTALGAVTPPSGTPVVVAGVRSRGYRELGADIGTLVSPALADSNYEGSELATGTITSFFADPDLFTYKVPTPTGDPYEDRAGRMLFAGTSGIGLWKAVYYGGPTQWLRE